jgi:flagellar basal body-associated protein FliL
MTEERITEHTDQDGHTHTTHTIVTEGERKSGGMTIVLLIVALIAVVAAIYLFSNMSNAEVAKDNAVGDAASQVGDAANQAGDAIENAADRVAPPE